MCFDDAAGDGQREARAAAPPIERGPVGDEILSTGFESRDAAGEHGLPGFRIIVDEPVAFKRLRAVLPRGGRDERAKRPLQPFGVAVDGRRKIGFAAREDRNRSLGPVRRGSRGYAPL